MSLTLAGRYVVTCLILTALFVVIGVVGRVITGAWDAEKVIAIAGIAQVVVLLTLVSRRWDA